MRVSGSAGQVNESFLKGHGHDRRSRALIRIHSTYTLIMLDHDVVAFIKVQVISLRAQVIFANTVCTRVCLYKTKKTSTRASIAE